MHDTPNTWDFAVGQQSIRLEVVKDNEVMSLIAELPLGDSFEQIAECICHFHNSYFKAAT